MIIKLLIAGTILSMFSACQSENRNPDPDSTSQNQIKSSIDSCGIKEGDIIFQTSNSGQSKAIQMATNSIYSHVGMIFFIDGDTMVLEAVQPVKLTPIDKFIDRGDNDYYEIKRSKSEISSAQIKKMKQTGSAYLNRDYDILFGWGDDKLYCSELVFKIYLDGTKDSLCTLTPLGAYDLKAQYVQGMLKKRYGINIPLEQKMVSPGDIFTSDKLFTVKKCSD